MVGGLRFIIQWYGYNRAIREGEVDILVVPSYALNKRIAGLALVALVTLISFFALLTLVAFITFFTLLTLLTLVAFVTFFALLTLFTLVAFVTFFALLTLFTLVAFVTFFALLTLLTLVAFVTFFALLTLLTLVTFVTFVAFFSLLAVIDGHSGAIGEGNNIAISSFDHRINSEAISKRTQKNTLGIDGLLKVVDILFEIIQAVENLVIIHLRATYQQHKQCRSEHQKSFHIISNLFG